MFTFFSKVWFKNRRAKFRQQNKQQQGAQNKTKTPLKRKTPPPPLQQVQDPAKTPIQTPPQQLNNFPFNGAPWTNKHNIQGMPNMQRQDNYQKLINNGINVFQSPNFPASQPHFSPNHEQYFPYMANVGPMAGDLSRNRIESSPMMC